MTEMKTEKRSEETPKFVVVGDYLCVETGGCTCGANHSETGPEPYCGLEPALPLAEVHAWLTGSVQATVSGFDGTPGRDYQLIEFRVPVGTLSGVRLGTRWTLARIPVAASLPGGVV